jgi:hypothetical protein
MKKPDKKPRIFTISFASVYPLYVQKAEGKGRTKAEVDEVITWLTGYSRAELQRVIKEKADLETFIAKAPQLNPNAHLITGVICGMRVEDIEDPVIQQIRYLDKLIDELARGKAMASILRQPSDAAAPKPKPKPKPKPEPKSTASRAPRATASSRARAAKPRRKTK